MFVVISLECRLRDNCPAGVDEPANSADHDRTALRTASLGAVGFYEEITKIILQLSSNMIKYTLYLFFCKYCNSPKVPDTQNVCCNQS